MLEGHNPQSAGTTFMTTLDSYLQAHPTALVAAIEADDPDELLATADARSGIIRLVAHVHKDAAAVILKVDDASVAMLGWTAAELVGHRTVEFVHPDDVQRAIDSWMEMRSDSGSGR